MNLTSRQTGPLPWPDAAARAHSEALTARLRGLIKEQGGHIGFDRYMEEVLYSPGLGYYSAGAAKFGAAGDFTTAPEVSPVFARCLARQCAEVLTFANGSILELGAGTGRMAAELLAELRRLGRLPVRYSILEPSADLRQRQQAALARADLADSVEVHWLDRLPDPADMGLILANEVVDALPVQRFVIRAGEARVRELAVTVTDDRFDWLEVPAGDALNEAVRHLEDTIGIALPAGYRAELCPSLGPWLKSVLACLRRGVAIISDYGLPRRQFYLPERSQGTLICHYRHRAHTDPFILVGLQDISAWVDFTALAEAADDAGWRVAGFTTQAHFLIGAGLEKVMQSMEGSDMKEKLRLASEVKTLTLPGEMGERFKFMALTREADISLSGFGITDMRGAL